MGQVRSGTSIEVPTYVCMCTCCALSSSWFCSGRKSLLENQQRPAGGDTETGPHLTDRETSSQKDRQTDRETGRQAVRQTDRLLSLLMSSNRKTVETYRKLKELKKLRKQKETELMPQ